MSTRIHKSLSHMRFGRTSMLGLFLPLFGALMFGGCPKQPVQPKFVRTGVIQPPRVNRKVIDTTPPTIALATDSGTNFNIPVLELSIPMPKAPPVHHVATAAEPEPEVKPQAPQISPQLSPQETTRAQGSAESDLRAAQQSLDSTSGRKLNENQQDLTDKINGFIKQAREAIATEDWIRASSLAQKARVLGEQLTHSF